MDSMNTIFKAPSWIENMTIHSMNTNLKSKFQNISEQEYFECTIENIDLSKEALNELTVDELRKLKLFIWTKREPIENAINEIADYEDIIPDHPLDFHADGTKISISVSEHDNDFFYVYVNDRLVFDSINKIYTVGSWEQVIMNRFNENLETERNNLIDLIVYSE